MTPRLSDEYPQVTSHWAIGPRRLLGDAADWQPVHIACCVACLRSWHAAADYGGALLDCRKRSRSAWPTAMPRRPAMPPLSTLTRQTGFGHALGNISTACKNRTPLVITAGHQARSILPPFLFSLQATKFPKPHVKSSNRVCTCRTCRPPLPVPTISPCSRLAVQRSSRSRSTFGINRPKFWQRDK